MTAASCQFFSRKTALWLGLAGILGSLMLFSGDMLFYFNGDQTDVIANMAVVAPQRITLSGLTALFAAWLYLLGAGQVYYAFQPATRWLRLPVFLSFASIMVAYGIVHGAYVAIATAAQIATQTGSDPHALAQQAISANLALRTVTYVPFAIFTVLFIAGIWMKQTHYPRWMILFSPIIPFLLDGPISSHLHGAIKIIIAGGYLNLILLLFFTASTLALALNSQNND